MHNYGTMTGGDPHEAEYYFDISAKRWWVLSPGSTSWEELPQVRVDELGLHNAVLREQCTFLDVSLSDYEAAVSRTSVKSPSDNKEDAVLKSAISESTIERQTSELDANPPVTERPSVDHYFLPSMSYSNISSLKSYDRTTTSCLAHLASGNTDQTDNEGPLQERFIKHNSTKSHEKAMVPLDSKGDHVSNGHSQWEKTSSFPGNIRRSVTSSQVIQNQLSHLIAETADIKRSYESKQHKPLEKIESFVRSAVRQVTQSDNSGIGDCIRAVAAERERMRQMATTIQDTEMPPERYQRMMARARTMAAVSLENDFKGRSVARGKRHSVLKELQRSATKDAGDGYEGDEAFDGSSDSDSKEQPTSEGVLESLMSQRLSLRRTLVRDPSNAID